jgi:hypothetical protein
MGSNPIGLTNFINYSEGHWIAGKKLCPLDLATSVGAGEGARAERYRNEVHSGPMTITAIARDGGASILRTALREPGN